MLCKMHAHLHVHMYICRHGFHRQVTGIDGNYRMTCERVLQVLRDHKDSVLAVLEAFVYDPLLNWRLMECKLFCGACTLGSHILLRNCRSVCCHMGINRMMQL